MYRFVRWLFHPILCLLFPTKILNKEKFPKDHAIVCCNHYASSDVIVVANKLFKKDFNVLAKAELFKSRFSSWFLRKMGAISIDRGEVDVAAFRASMAVLKAGEQLVVFPEGTRNRPDNMQLQPLLPGAVTFALKGDCDIIPMVIHKKMKPFRRTYMMVGRPISLAAFKDMGAHAAREAATELLYDTMCRLKAELDETVAAKRGKKQQK